ncbi:hypothetical protein NHL50_09840 [Acidimicrobiia bacterium EGI L10123]|uniref:hypothetical protein n=1 Tax=Salinilacustrithrix flava TaxID=2957203 RepID=UPI003D7C1B9F|nr:hypothetical protein [Acidimicrobiia bacterium EGI L10123]
MADARQVAGDAFDGLLPETLAGDVAMALRVYGSLRSQLLAHVHGEARPGSHDDGATLNEVSSALLTSLPALAAAAASHGTAQRRQDAPPSSYVGSYQRMGTQEILLGSTGSGVVRVALGNVRHRHKPVPTTSLVVCAAAGLLAAADEHAEAIIDDLGVCLAGVDVRPDLALVHVRDVPVVRDRIADRLAGDVLVETDDGPDPGSSDDPGDNFLFGSVLGRDGDYAHGLEDWAGIELDDVPAVDAGRYIGAVWVAALSETTAQRPAVPALRFAEMPHDVSELRGHGTTLMYGMLEAELHCRNLVALEAFCETFRPDQPAHEHVAALYPLLEPAVAELAGRFQTAAER